MPQDQTLLDQQTLELSVSMGHFDPTLLSLAESLAERLHDPAIESSDPVRLFRTIGHVGRVLDHFGRYAEARSFWERFPVDAWIKDLEAEKEVPDNEFRMAQGKVWAILAYLQHSRRSVAGQPIALSAEVFEKWKYCYKFVNSRLQQPNEGRRCSATLGWCFALRGFLEGDQGNASEAANWFQAAISEFQDRASRMASDPEKSELETEVLEYRRAYCEVLGNATLKWREGALDEAESILTYVGAFVENQRDEVLRAYHRMLFYCIHRAKDSKESSGRIILQLEDAKKIFETLLHTSHYARACFELALAYFHTEDYQKSEEYLKLCEGTQCWTSCSVDIVRSRLNLKVGMIERAAELAEQALQRAKEQARPVLGEAYLVRGEVYLAQALALQAKKPRGGDELFEKADSDFRQAEISLNAKLRAVATIHRADLMLKSWRPSKAWELLDQYDPELKVQNAFVLRLAKTVRDQLKDLNEFVIRADAEDLKYDTHWNGVRRFLFYAAKRKTKGGKRNELARILGIQPTTLDDWINQLDLESE